MHGQTTGCRVTGCVRETTGEKPFCVQHIEASPYVRAVQRHTPRANRLSARPIDGYLRLLERIGFVKTVKRGGERVVVWCRRPEGLIKSAS